MDRTTLIRAACVLATLPVLALVFTLAGRGDLVEGFWNDYRWFALGFVVLFGGASLIYSLVKKRKKR